MKLNQTKPFYRFCMRLYEEDYNEMDIVKILQPLYDKGARITIVKHSKDNAKTHFHVLVTNVTLRLSALLNLGFKESELSDVKDTYAMYVYMIKHKGKEEEDKINHHTIEVISDMHMLEDKKAVDKMNREEEIAAFFLYIQNLQDTSDVCWCLKDLINQCIKDGYNNYVALCLRYANALLNWSKYIH